MPVVRSSSHAGYLFRRHQRGMTLVELMVTVSIAGILAATATASYTKQVNLAHSAEAVEMLGNVKNAVQVSSLDVGRGGDLDFSKNTFGKGNAAESDADADNGTGNDSDSGKGSGKDGSTGGDIDGDGNNGHGDSDGCDPSNPSGKCKGNGSDSDDSSTDSSPSPSDTTDNDGNNGHGNDESKCDPSNPGKSKEGCEGSDTSGGDDDGGGSDTTDSSSGSGPGGGTDTGSGGVDSLCGSATPVPESIDLISGKMYNPPPSAWEQGNDTTGWRCLRVSRSGNQTYQFGYDVGAGTITDSTEGYTAWARGDLDGDGRTSLFRIRGELVKGTVVHAPSIEIIDQAE